MTPGYTEDERSSSYIYLHLKTAAPTSGAASGEALLGDGGEPRGRHGRPQAGARRGAGGQGGARAAGRQSSVTEQTTRVGLVIIPRAKLTQPNIDRTEQKRTSAIVTATASQKRE